MCDGVQGVDLASVTGNGWPNCQSLYFVDQGLEVREDLNGSSVQNHLSCRRDPRNAVMKNAVRGGCRVEEGDKESELLSHTHTFLMLSVCIEEISALWFRGTASRR